MKEIEACKAKTHLEQILDRVCKGEKFIITERGHAVARLGPPVKAPEQIRNAISTIETLRQEITTDGVSLRQMIEDERS